MHFAWNVVCTFYQGSVVCSYKSELGQSMLMISMDDLITVQQFYRHLADTIDGQCWLQHSFCPTLARDKNRKDTFDFVIPSDCDTCFDLEDLVKGTL